MPRYNEEGIDDYITGYIDISEFCMVKEAIQKVHPEVTVKQMEYLRLVFGV